MDQSPRTALRLLVIADERAQIIDAAYDLMAQGWLLSNVRPDADLLQQVDAQPWDALVIDQADWQVSLAVIEQIRSTRPALPIFQILSVADPPLMQRLMQAGAADVICGPFDQQDLPTTLRRSIAQHRSQSQAASSDIDRRLSRLSHDINNALTSISGIAQLLLDDERLPDDMHADLVQIVEMVQGIRTRLERERRA